MLILLAEGKLSPQPPWQCPAGEESVPAAGPVMLPPDGWRQQIQAGGDATRLALLLAADADLENLSTEIAAAGTIGLHFPSFTDGRPFSLAQLLRRKPYGYTGHLIAIGSFLPDQVSFMHRCGFDAAQFDDASRAEQALGMLHPFSTPYQRKFGVQ